MPNVEVRRDLGEYRDAWDAAVLAAPHPSPYLRSWWLQSIADEQARYLLVLDGDQLLGGLPIEVVRRYGIDRVRIMGDEFRPINLDVVAQSGAHDLVAKQVWMWLRARRNCMIEIDGLGPATAFADATWGLTTRELSAAPYLELPSCHEEFLALRSSKYRKELRRAARRLAEFGYEHRVVTPDETAWGLSELQRLHHGQFGDRSEFMPVFDRFSAAAPAGIANGELRLHVLASKDRAAAVSVVLELGDLMVGDQGGRDVHDRALGGAGSVLLDALIAEGCAAGKRELDFHRYPDEYKLKLATGVRPVHVISGSWGPTTQVALAARRSRSRVRRIYRRLRSAGGRTTAVTQPSASEEASSAAAPDRYKQPLPSQAPHSKAPGPSMFEGPGADAAPITSRRDRE